MKCRITKAACTFLRNFFSPKEFKVISVKIIFYICFSMGKASFMSMSLSSLQTLQTLETQDIMFYSLLFNSLYLLSGSNFVINFSSTSHQPRCLKLSPLSGDNAILNHFQQTISSIIFLILILFENLLSELGEIGTCCSRTSKVHVVSPNQTYKKE